MIKVENIEVSGWKSAIRGMRNPMNSWEKIDSNYCREIERKQGTLPCSKCPKQTQNKCYLDDTGCFIFYAVGDNDLELMKKLVKSGADHSKFMRMINVSMDIIAPLYWWKQFDTYKVGVVSNSTSTMHKIHDREFTLDDFSHEYLFYYECYNDGKIVGYAMNGDAEQDDKSPYALNLLKQIIDKLNFYREQFVKTRNKDYWWQIIQLLPSSYNQLRTVQLNYAVLERMYHARKNHKLDEWKNFCNIILLELPYFAELIGEKEK